MPGRKAEVAGSLRKHTMKFFARHGIHVVGFWDTAVGDQDELIYITGYASHEDRRRSGARSTLTPSGRDP